MILNHAMKKENGQIYRNITFIETIIRYRVFVKIAYIG
jgi:hypothetical protein